jgi:hypothetical protein
MLNFTGSRGRERRRNKLLYLALYRSEKKGEN